MRVGQQTHVLFVCVACVLWCKEQCFECTVSEGLGESVKASAVPAVHWHSVNQQGGRLVRSRIATHTRASLLLLLYCTPLTTQQRTSVDPSPQETAETVKDRTKSAVEGARDAVG